MTLSLLLLLVVVVVVIIVMVIVIAAAAAVIAGDDLPLAKSKYSIYRTRSNHAMLSGQRVAKRGRGYC